MVEKTGVTEQDLWIHEMRYRVAVGVLQETWATCSKGLGDLFIHMKTTEMTRRQVRVSKPSPICFSVHLTNYVSMHNTQAIHGSLQTLHDQQTAYWKKLPDLAQTLSTLVQNRVADPQLIEKEIGNDIRIGAQRLEQSEVSYLLSRETCMQYNCTEAG